MRCLSPTWSKRLPPLCNQKGSVFELNLLQTVIWSGKRGSETAREDLTVTIADPLAPEIEKGAVGSSLGMGFRMDRAPLGAQAV